MADDKFDPTTAKPVDATPDGFDPSSAYVPTIGGELKKGALRGIDTMQQGGYGLIAAAANAAGAKGVEDWAREGVARNAQEAQENPAAVGRIEDIGGVRDAALWASGGLGEQAAPMAISIAGAAVGAPGAGYAAKALGAAPGVIARAAEIGAIVGAGATSIGQETGSIAADQIQDGNLQPGKALAYGVPAGLLDVIPESRIIRRIAGHGKAMGVARDIGTQTVLGGATEAAQTALERKGNDKEVLSKEGISEMLNAAALGALGDGVVRAVSRPFDGAAAPAEPPPPEPVISGLLPAPGQIPIQGGQGDFRTAEQIQAEIDAERNASEIYAARDAFEAARRPPPPPPNAGLLPAPGETVIPVPPAGTPGPNLDAEAADINAGAIQEARDAYEARQAALRAGAQQPAPLALPAPGMPLGNTVLPNDAGPFSVTQTHIANDAQDHANAVEAAREAEIARLEASGPIGRAAAASMRTGAAQMAGASRAEEASGGPPASPLALPEPLTEKDKRAQEQLTKFAADLPAVTLAQAQAVAQRATERYGEPVVVVPHPSGRGFTAVPQKVVSDGIRQQFDGIQREGGLPSPKPPESQLAVSPSGEVAAQPVPEGMRSAMADWRRDMDTPTPKGAEPTGAAPPPIPPQLPIKKREAAVAKAEKLTAETGREHEVVPHPFMRNAFAVRPVERVQEPAPSTEGERASEANKAPATDEPKVGTDVPKMGTDDARSELDTAAHEAATSLENELPQPTKAQAEAGNYRKGHVKLHGLDISIENPAGSVRVGESEDGNSWASSMPHHYGYIRRSEGADGDHVDTFIGPKPDAKTVFVVNQVDPKTGKFDEHKVMLGFDTQDQAEAAYRAAYPKDWSGMGSVVATDVDGLKAWLKDGDTTTPFGEAVAGKERGTKEANALTHRPSALVHVKANPLADGVPLPPSSVAKKVMSEPPLVVTDQFDGRKTPAHLVKTVLSILGDAMRLGLPPSAIDGINSFYIKRKDTGAEYAIEAQSIGFSLDTLEAQYRGSQAWASTNVGHAIHEVGHHITGDETGTSYVAMSPAFEVSTRDGKRVAVGAVMREALDAYSAGGELGAFLRYPLDNWGAAALDGLSIQDVTIVLQEEVFAQSWALYFTNPKLLRSRMPQTFRLMEEVANAAKSETTIAGARRAVQRTLRSWRPEMGDQVGRGARLAVEAGTREREADRGLGGGRGVLAQGTQARSGLGLAAPVPVDRLLNVDRDTQREVYGRFGELTDRNTADDLKVYDLSKLVDDPSLTRDLLARTGFKVEYFSFEENPDKGVTFRIPQLKKNGYQQGTLWIYDPRNSHGAFNDIEYTRQWRIVHELGHGLSERFMQAKYGDSKRQGRLGMPSTFPVGRPPKQVMREQRPLTLREAQRAVEWEDVAFRTQRMLMEELGVKVDPKDFAREYNINISDAIYRVLTADFGDPGDFGLVPKTELPNLKSILELLANTERELAKTQGREPTDGVDLSTWRPVSDLELRGAIRGARRPGTLDAETPIKHAVRLETRTFKGRVGDRSHITRTDEGTIATSLIANLAGERGEKRGEHRNRIGEEWDQFKRDIAVNGINEPIFITVDPGVGARVSEGNHRLDAAIELGLSTVPVDIRYYGHAERDGLVHERAKRSGALDVKTPIVYRGEHGRDEPAAEVRPAREEVASEDLRGDGRGFTAFFTDATTGGRKPNTGKRFEPVIDISRADAFSREYEKHRGNFDDHIATSIPGFRETQQAVGNAIAKSLPNGGAVLDIGASEGSFIKAITALSGGKIKTVGLDPNVAMAKFFREHSSVPGSTYEMAAFGARSDEGVRAWNEPDGTPVHFFKPKEKFDIVHEAMTFQFISNAREGQVARVKELMKSGGVALFEQKFIPEHDEFARNEAKKDSYKALYYSAAELDRKKKDVLERGEAAVAQDEKDKEEKVVGMHDLMVSPEKFEKILGDNFAHVVQYWDSGNFKGYAASDNPLALSRLVSNIGDLNSEYSTIETPSTVKGASRPKTLDVKSPVEQPRNAAKLEDFAAGKIKGILRKANWAIITAENPGARTLPAELNAKRNKRLERDLKKIGAQFKPVTGRYGGNDEHSYIVTGITPEQAAELRDKYAQDAVLTRRGLEHADGSITKATGVTEHTTAPDDYFSVVLPNGPYFTVDLGERTAATRVPTELRRFLTAEEFAALDGRPQRIAKVVEVLKTLPSPADFEAAALAGRAQRGWYRRVLPALAPIFGSDSPRFVSLVAALSPQTDVRGNILNAVRVWAAWERAGKTRDAGRLANIFRDNLVTDAGREGGKEAMEAWTQNGTRALLAADPMAEQLSGPKVESFRRNLMGDENEVTNDRHMAAFGGIPQTMFAGAKTKDSPLARKGPGYIAMSVRTRQAAAALSRYTGEPWTPAEVQETVWSWWKAVIGLAEAEGQDRTALQLVRDGAITDELVRSTPQFGDFLNDPEIAGLLARRGEGARQPADRDLGVPGEARRGPASEAGPAPAQAALERIARRADRLLAARRRLERLKAEVKAQDAELQERGVAEAQEIADLEAEIRRIEAEDRADDIPGFDGPPKRPSKLEAKSAVAEPLWYSRLEQALEKAPWSKAGDMPVGQLRMWVAARSKDGTLPAEEVKWSGLLDYLDMYAESKPKLQRSDVTSYLAQNGVRVEEVELGLDDQARLIKAEDALIKYLVTTKEFTHIGAREYALDAARGDLSASQFEAIEDGEHVRLVQNLRSAYQDRNDRAGGGQTKYHEYQLPGGKNYRELLLTLPEAPTGEYGRFVRWAIGAGVTDRARLRRAFDEREKLYHEWRRLDEAEKVPTLGDIIDRGDNVNARGEFRSSHFDQPNILAHIRFNERRAADGSRVLFIEEIQSDWAQKGRKSGFVGKESDARKERDALMDEANNINRAPPTAERMAEIQRRLRELNDTGASVPTAPFVGKTEAWVALALKRMIRYAADNGFDAVAWTNGEQQADRYDLSQYVDNVRIAKYGGGEFDIQARKGGDVVLSETQATQGRIAELVGKDIADKAARQEDGTHKTYSGLDLKVGGEGMKAFYDQIVRNVANDLLKKMGGGRVGMIELGRDRSLDPYEDPHALISDDGMTDLGGLRQPGFYLTPETLPKAKRPQALFARTEVADVTQTPEFKAWFGGSKVVDADGRPLVVYHGSERSGFSVFNESERGGFYFTNHIWGAQTYSGTKRAASIDDNVRAPGNYAVYLSLRDPMIVDFDGRGWDGSGPDGDVDPTVHMDEVVREAKDNGHDGVIALNINDEGRFGQGYGWGDVTYVAFRPEQIKSAIGNRGTFDAKRPSILESRGELAERAQNLVADTLTTQRSFNLWDRTVGTQFHKSWKDPDFRKVYQGVQNYLNDASRLMMEAADLAPNVLPKLEGVRGILGVTASKADLEAMSSAIFDGTLQDVVYTDAQLAARGMSPEAIELYRETRSAIDRSLTDVFVSEAIKEAKGLLPEDVLAQARERGDPWIVVDALSGIPVAQRSEVQQQVYDQLRERAARIEALKQAGYAPLMRFGRYTVHMADANGGSLSFTMHESEREANAVARALRSEYPQHRVTQGVLSEDAWQLFQGISPDTLEIFAESVGASEKQLFQKYLKLATNNRSTLRRLIQRKKIPGFSPDAQRALAQFLTSNGRAASRNYHWGEVLKAANDVPKEKGDVKDEAVRLAQYVQHPSEEAGALRGLLFIQFLGGSVASALTNATQPVLMSFPYLSRFGAGKAASALLGASKIAVGGVAPEADLRSAMARATEEGIIAPHEVAGLYAESIRNLGSNLVIRRILRAWGSLFSLAEAFNRRITFAAAFRLARDAGEADPYGFAVNAIAETQGVYNRGNRPNWARGAVGATIFTFKQYSIAYVEFLRRLPAKERAIAVAVLVLAAGIQGLPGADDLEDVVDTIAESLGYSFNSKKAAREWAIRTLGDTAGGLLSEGFSGLPGVPIDVQARLGLGNLIPGTGLLKRSNPDRSREVLEVFGPAGSQAKAFADAFSAAQEGNLAQIARSGLPLALQNAMKAVDMVSTGYYNDSRGRRVIDVDAYEAAIKGIGVQPKRVAEVQRRRQDLQQDVALQKDVEAEISDLWARGIFERDQEKVKRARAKLLDWNLANPESRIVIAPQQIQKRVQQASMTADQRFIKTAPPELRSRVAEELLR